LGILEHGSAARLREHLSDWTDACGEYPANRMAARELADALSASGACGHPETL